MCSMRGHWCSNLALAPASASTSTSSRGCLGATCISTLPFISCITLSSCWRCSGERVHVYRFTAELGLALLGFGDWYRPRFSDVLYNPCWFSCSSILFNGSWVLFLLILRPLPANSRLFCVEDSVPVTLDEAGKPEGFIDCGFGFVVMIS